MRPTKTKNATAPAEVSTEPSTPERTAEVEDLRDRLPVDNGWKVE